MGLSWSIRDFSLCESPLCNSIVVLPVLTGLWLFVGCFWSDWGFYAYKLVVVSRDSYRRPFGSLLVVFFVFDPLFSCPPAPPTPSSASNVVSTLLPPYYYGKPVTHSTTVAQLQQLPALQLIATASTRRSQASSVAKMHLNIMVVLYFYFQDTEFLFCGLLTHKHASTSSLQSIRTWRLKKEFTKSVKTPKNYISIHSIS